MKENRNWIVKLASWQSNFYNTDNSSIKKWFLVVEELPLLQLSPQWQHGVICFMLLTPTGLLSITYSNTGYLVFCVSGTHFKLGICYVGIDLRKLCGAQSLSMVMCGCLPSWTTLWKGNATRFIVRRQGWILADCITSPTPHTHSFYKKFSNEAKIIQQYPNV